MHHIFGRHIRIRNDVNGVSFDPFIDQDRVPRAAPLWNPLSKRFVKDSLNPALLLVLACATIFARSFAQTS